MARLFEPLALGGLTVENRIVVSPMCQYSAEDGAANDWHLVHLGQFILGGPGVVFTEACAVSPEGRISPEDLGLYSDACEAALRPVVAFGRAHGRSRLGIQLAHAGRKGSTYRPWSGKGSVPRDQGGWETVGPSALPFVEAWQTPRALDEAGIAKVKADFVRAAERSARLGFDVIELHFAHGYLVHEFLSPIANHRGDRYGGSLENRMRLALEIFEAVRAVFPGHLPVGVRISATDWTSGGWDIEQSVALAHELKARGCVFIDVSSGAIAPNITIPTAPGYQTGLSARIRQETGIVTCSVGMIRSPEQAEHVIVSGQADLVALARGMLDDPHWAWRAAKALRTEAYHPPQYLRAREL